MTNSHGNEEDLCPDFGKFSHAARGLIRHKYSTVSQEREKPKHTGGRRSAHRIKEMDGAFTRKKKKKKPCSAGEGLSLSSHDQFSVTRPIG